MNKLPKCPPTIIHDWNVCAEYQNLEHLKQVVSGVDSIDARGVLELNIRAVDRVWVLLRVEFIPREVLAKIMTRIKQGLKSIKKDKVPKRLASGMRRHERAENYWMTASRIASMIVRSSDGYKGNSAAMHEKEFERQLSIIREEIDNWAPLN